MPDDLAELRELSGREEVLAETGQHPHARLTTAGAPLRAFATDGAVGWLTRSARGGFVSALGEPEAALRLLVTLADRGELSGVRRVSLPRVDQARLAAHLPVGEVDEWDFRWARQPPPPQLGEERVQRLPDAAAPQVDQLLARAFPGTFTRPGDPQVRCWYGVWDGDRLIACGADRSRGGVGSLSAITVDVDRQGRGWGAALTAAMARSMFAEWDVVTLGVMTDNHHADRLYRRLGFVEASPRSAANLQR